MLIWCKLKYEYDLNVPYIYIYIYIYTRLQKGWHFKNIYIFCFFGQNKRKNKRYIYLYIFLKCQPFCKRVYIYILLGLEYNKFRERSTLRGAVIIMINGSKISIHRFIATTLFRMVIHSLLPDECGHSLTLRNSVVAIKRWTEILLPLIIIYYHYRQFLEFHLCSFLSFTGFSSFVLCIVFKKVLAPSSGLCELKKIVWGVPWAIKPLIRLRVSVVVLVV